MRNFEIDVVFVLIEIVRFRFFNRSESDLAATSPIKYCNKVRRIYVEIGTLTSQWNDNDCESDDDNIDGKSYEQIILAVPPFTEEETIEIQKFVCLDVVLA